MTDDVRAQIRAALRDEEDARLTADEAAAMRRVIVASVRADDGRQPSVSWFQPLAIGATLVVMIAAGIALGERFDARTPPAAARGDRGTAAGEQPPPSRQLHFSTPGGTRIIWIFNSDLELKTTP